MSQSDSSLKLMIAELLIAFGIATAGYFVIRDVGENYGNTTRIEKDVRVVTNATFFLTD